MRRVNVLGAVYRVCTGVSYRKDSGLKGRFGYCSFSDRRIVVGDLSTCDTWKDESKEAREAQERLTLRHELIHAFLRESGLDSSSCGAECWARNEEMVDWVAIQYPKISAAFRKMGCDV